MLKINSTVLSKISTQKDMDEFVKALDLKGDTILIKPNWVQARDGAYTEAKVLDMFLTGLNKKAIFIESYTFWRTDKYVVGGGDYFSSSEADLEQGKKHWQHFKEQDAWFLKATGIGDVLKKHGAEYINITEEVWSGRVVDQEEIKKIVEQKYEPVEKTELYQYIPQKLFDLRGCDLVSFAKAKREKEYGFTLSTKNLFGLIPDPSRYPKYHGEDDGSISASVRDVNKIYRSIFNCHFLIDGVFNASFSNGMEEIACVKDWGVIAASDNSIELDKIMANLLKVDMSKAELDVLEKSYGLFGSFDENLIKEIPNDLKINYWL